MEPVRLTGQGGPTIVKKPITVSRGRIEATAANKTEAKAALEQRIDWYLSQGEPWVETRFGFTLIVAAMPNGDWTSMLVAPTYVGKRQWFSAFSREEHIDAVIFRLRLHAAQSAWRLDSDDREICVQSGLADVSDLKRWIAFQRKYAALKAEGLSDGDAHHEACLAA